MLILILLKRTEYGHGLTVSDESDFPQNIWQTEKYPHTNEIILGKVKHFIQTTSEHTEIKALKKLWRKFRGNN